MTDFTSPAGVSPAHPNPLGLGRHQLCPLGPHEVPCLQLLAWLSLPQACGASHEFQVDPGSGNAAQLASQNQGGKCLGPKSTGSVLWALRGRVRVRHLPRLCLGLQREPNEVSRAAAPAVPGSFGGM